MNKLIKKHAVMMEYVIVAVLVAAVVVVAVLFFGRSVKDEFDVASRSMFDANKAESMQTTAKGKLDGNVSAAENHAKAMNDYGGNQSGKGEKGKK